MYGYTKHLLSVLNMFAGSVHGSVDRDTLISYTFEAMTSNNDFAATHTAPPCSLEISSAECRQLGLLSTALRAICPGIYQALQTE